MSKKAVLHCDGGSRGNPGPSAGGAVLSDESGTIIAEKGEFYGTQTNNFAEYSSLICGLKLALEQDITNLVISMDSSLVVGQMSKGWKMKSPNLRPLWERAHALVEQFESIEFTHVLRHLNKNADALVNQTLDARRL